MIKTDKIIINGKEYFKTYSDKHKQIIQNETGAIYTEAIDIDTRYTYKESNIDIKSKPKKPDLGIY